MSLVATFNVPTMATCPPGNVYSNVTQYLQQNATVTINDTGGTTITQYATGTTPTPTAGAVWYRQNTDAFHPFPMGIYGVYNGRWVKFTNAVQGELRWLVFDPTNLMDSTGLGLFIPAVSDTPFIAGNLFGWALCNGKNGTISLQNRFPLAGNKFNDPAAPGVWSAGVEQLDGTFVQDDHGGNDGTFPQNAIPPLNAAKYVAGANNPLASLYGGVENDGNVITINPTSGPQQKYAPVYPLYRAVGVFQFVGYGAVTSS
jgi:hypothetical protein